MRQKQLAHNIFDGKRGKSGPAGPAHIVKNEALELAVLRLKLRSH